MKTPISYYGGKQSIMSHILPLIPQHEVYTEVFFGGGAVYWAKDAVPNETINDKNDIVVNFYEQLKSNCSDLKKLIDMTLCSRSQHRRALSYIRGQVKCTKVELAWAFWLCANFSFANKIGGGIKYSNHMGTIVSKTMQTKKNAFTETLVARIEHAQIENKDALDVLQSRNVDKAFHYLDPPYCNADMGHYAGMFNEIDLNSLLSFLTRIKGKFLLSHYPHPLIDEYLTKNENWKTKSIIHRIKAPRKTGTVRHEMLIWNY